MRKKSREEGELYYPKHQVKPEDTLDFIEMEGWARDCKRLGLNKMDVAAIRVCIMSGPERSPVIKGTGGVRKGRYAPSHWQCGKSGAARICYVYFKEYSLVLFVKAYSKDERANLSGYEKVALRKAIREIAGELSRRSIN